MVKRNKTMGFSFPIPIPTNASSANTELSMKPGAITHVSHSTEKRLLLEKQRKNQMTSNH
jgi:hypothetical protein